MSDKLCKCYKIISWWNTWSVLVFLVHFKSEINCCAKCEEFWKSDLLCKYWEICSRDCKKNCNIFMQRQNVVTIAIFVRSEHISFSSTDVFGWAMLGFRENCMWKLTFLTKFCGYISCFMLYKAIQCYIKSMFNSIGTCWCSSSLLL